MSDHLFSEPSRAQAKAVRDLNDAFRRTFAGGAVMLTSGIIALGGQAQAAILAKIRAFEAFSSENDPYGEHDFGAFEHEGDQVFFKIDYYDPDLVYGSADPADPGITKRVLTVLLASEY